MEGLRFRARLSAHATVPAVECLASVEYVVRPVLVSPGGLLGLWERAVELTFGRRRGPTDPNPIDVGQVEPSV